MDSGRRAEMPSGDATIVGLIGDPVAHSLSPVMHNSAFRALAMDWMYAPFPVADEGLSRALDGVRALGMRGVNVTIPHKEAVIPLLDECTDAARAAGAVNTIVHERGRLIGDNTDGIGFVRSLQVEADFDPEGARVLLFGAGGAAKAIAVALADAGAEHIAIVNRTVARAKGLATDVARRGVATAAFGLDEASMPDVVGDAHLLVQTTPAGMAGSGPDFEGMLPAPLQPDWLHGDLVIADIVYTPLETPLVESGVARGCTIVPGWGMLLHQGAEAFARWTGRAAPVDVMREALLRSLGVDTVKDAGSHRKGTAEERGTYHV